MDRRITSRLNMANAVVEVCDSRPDVVALVPAFVLLVAALKSRITALNNLMQRLSANTSGYYEDKVKWKDKLSLLLSMVCGAGVSYSRKIGDVVLERNFSFAETTLFGLRDTELIQTANSLIALQATVAAQLVPYGITIDLMTQVNEALDNFEEVNPKPIVNVYTSEADREQLLDMAFDLSDFVLQDMMKAALIYKVLDLNFYQSLENASRISKVGIRHEEPPVEGEGVAKEAAAAPEEMMNDAIEDMQAGARSVVEAPSVPVEEEELSENGVH
ncbi:MAG: hypothetical protein HY842_19325 [Bacteroidetes bacterium]|nr:hypothetical protein [Bacteroidota bacterium]